MTDAVYVALIAAAASSYAVWQNRTIHKLVNSQLTAVKAELVAAQVKIEELQDLVVKLTQQEMDP